MPYRYYQYQVALIVAAPCPYITVLIKSHTETQSPAATLIMLLSPSIFANDVRADIAVDATPS